MKACLVASHGPFTWGKDLEEDVFISLMLEEIAQINVISKIVNPNLKNIKKTFIDKYYLRKHGEHAYYRQEQLSKYKK